MEKLPSVRVIIMTIIAIILVNIIFSFDYNIKKKEISSKNTTVAYLSKKYSTNSSISTKEITNNVLDSNIVTLDILKKEVDYSEVYPEIYPDVSSLIVYDGMTLQELGDKLDRNLKSSLSGYGYIIASYAIEYDVDPYMALAIILHETGCASGKCSTLTSKCNNVGGMKGGPSCGNGSYKRFDTLDQGIEAFMKNLSNNYIKKGLTTPEAINKKYAESSSWSNRVKYYINRIKNS